MPVKSDTWIIEQSRLKAMIHPFAETQVKRAEGPDGAARRLISYGVSSYGYDMRIGHTFQIFEGGPQNELDPKRIDPNLFKTVEVEHYLILPPQRLVLGQTVEYFKIPRDILTICFGKSTYARCGVIVNVTPFEPEWEGHATVSICNTGSSPVRLYAGEGIAQLLFLQSDDVCAVSYADKGGKYQAQKTITAAKV